MYFSTYKNFGKNTENVFSNSSSCFTYLTSRAVPLMYDVLNLAVKKWFLRLETLWLYASVCCRFSSVVQEDCMYWTKQTFIIIMAINQLHAVYMPISQE